MSVIVTDEGFHPLPDSPTLPGPEALEEGLSGSGAAIDLPPDARAEAIAPHFARLALIRIAFPAFADGRGFTLAQRLRQLGYRGRLRAVGHVLADQYAMARRCGFDEVEIDDELACRQPEEDWLFRADWRAHDYQSRLRA